MFASPLALTYYSNSLFIVYIPIAVLGFAMRPVRTPTLPIVQIPA